MGFPDKKTLDKMREKLENVEGTKAFNKEDATPLETLRFEICQTLLKKAKSDGLTNREMAQVCEVDESDISKIFHYRVERFSTDKLMKILSKVFPEHSVLLKVS